MKVYAIVAEAYDSGQDHSDRGFGDESHIFISGLIN